MPRVPTKRILLSHPVLEAAQVARSLCRIVQFSVSADASDTPNPRESLPHHPATSNLCKQPNCSTASVEDLPHALVHCSSNNGVGLKVVQAARSLIPGVTVEDLLQLNFRVEEDKELGIVWWLAAGLMAIWNLRTARKRVEQYLIRAQLEAKIYLLRETIFADAVEILDTLLVEL